MRPGVGDRLRGTVTRRQDLRAQVIDISGGTCEWPSCTVRGVELAHLHSVGAGGRKSADTLSNVMWACYDHARISDGEYGEGGRTQYLAAHDILFNGMWPVAWEELGCLAWERAEALRVHLKRTRPIG